MGFCLPKLAVSVGLTSPLMCNKRERTRKIKVEREEKELANHASAWKRIRQNEKRYERNKLYRGRVRTFIKRVREQIELKDAEGAAKALQEATVVIAKASSKGVIHSKRASRNISRLTRQVNALSAS